MDYKKLDSKCPSCNKLWTNAGYRYTNQFKACMDCKEYYFTAFDFDISIIEDGEKKEKRILLDFHLK